MHVYIKLWDRSWYCYQHLGHAKLHSISKMCQNSGIFTFCTLYQPLSKDYICKQSAKYVHELWLQSVKAVQSKLHSHNRYMIHQIMHAANTKHAITQVNSKFVHGPLFLAHFTVVLSIFCVQYIIFLNLKLSALLEILNRPIILPFFTVQLCYNLH